MKKIFGLAGLLFFLAVWLAPVKEAKAIAAWARRYNVDCTMCHTMYPRLNPTGEKFRRLGYRMPDEFDNKDPMSIEDLTKFTNYFSGSATPRILFSKTNTQPAALTFQVDEVDLFYAGPVTRNAAFFFEFPFDPTDNGRGALEVGQINLNFGDSDHFFYARIGQFHQFSETGYGGLGRPIGLSKPSLFTVPVNGFDPGLTAMGVEVAYSYENFTARLQGTNGITAAGISSLDNNDQNKNKDIAVLLQYMIPNHDASVSALYVYGQEPTPESTPGVLVPGAKGTQYNRFYAFGDYTFDSIGLKPIVGGGVGWDNQFVTGIGTAAATLVSSARSRSWFAFLELDKELMNNFYALGRADVFDPTNKAEAASETRTTWAATGGLVWGFQKWLRTTLEYQMTDNKVQHVVNSVTGELRLVF